MMMSTEEAWAAVKVEVAESLEVKEVGRDLIPMNDLFPMTAEAVEVLVRDVRNRLARLLTIEKEADRIKAVNSPMMPKEVAVTFLQEDLTVTKEQEMIEARAHPTSTAKPTKTIESTMTERLRVPRTTRDPREAEARVVEDRIVDLQTIGNRDRLDGTRTTETSLAPTAAEGVPEEVRDPLSKRMAKITRKMMNASTTRIVDFTTPMPETTSTTKKMTKTRSARLVTTTTKMSTTVPTTPKKKLKNLTDLLLNFDALTNYHFP